MTGLRCLKLAVYYPRLPKSNKSGRRDPGSKFVLLPWTVREQFYVPARFQILKLRYFQILTGSAFPPPLLLPLPHPHHHQAGILRVFEAFAGATRAVAGRVRGAVRGEPSRLHGGCRGLRGNAGGTPVSGESGKGVLRALS